MPVDYTKKKTVPVPAVGTDVKCCCLVTVMPYLDCTLVAVTAGQGRAGHCGYGTVGM